MADTTAVLEARVQVVDDSATQNFVKMAGAADSFSKKATSSFQSVKREIAGFRSNLAIFGGAFAQIAGFGIGFESLVTGLRGMFNEWKSGEEALLAFTARERIAGTETAGLSEQIRKLAQTNREALGASTEETANLAIRARAIGLTGDEISAAVTAAETMGKVFKSDVKGALDLVAKGMTGSKEAMRDFGVELGLRINNAEEFTAALRKVQAELLDLRAAKLSESVAADVFSGAGAYAGQGLIPGQTDFKTLGDKVKAEIAALKAQAAELRTEASKIVGPESGSERDFAKKTDAATEATRRFSVGVDQLVIAAERTDSIPDRVASINDRTRVELEKLAHVYEETRKKIDEAVTGKSGDPTGFLREEVDVQYRNARAAIAARANADKRKLIGSGGDGAFDALREGADQLADAYGRGKRAVIELGDAFEKNLGQAAYDAVTKATSAAGAIKGFVKGFFDDIARAASQSLAGLAKAGLFAGLKAIFGGGGDPFAANPGNVGADGGWFDSGGWHGARVGGSRFASLARGADVRRFADGGTVTRPTLGLFGEAGPEAFVPLKGGRIPVSIRGGGGGNVLNLYLSAIDTQSGLSFLAEHREHLWGLWRDGFDRRSEFRGMARRT